MAEKDQARVYAILSHRVCPVEGLGGADCQAHYRVRFTDPEVLRNVIELSIDIPQNLASLHSHELSVGMLLERVVKARLLHLLQMLGHLLLLAHDVIPVNLGLKHRIKLFIIFIPFLLASLAAFQAHSLLQCIHQTLYRSIKNFNTSFTYLA